jgi:hypothetical protein
MGTTTSNNTANITAATTKNNKKKITHQGFEMCLILSISSWLQRRLQEPSDQQGYAEGNRSRIS